MSKLLAETLIEVVRMISNLDYAVNQQKNVKDLAEKTADSYERFLKEYDLLFKEKRGIENDLRKALFALSVCEHVLGDIDKKNKGKKNKTVSTVKGVLNYLKTQDNLSRLMRIYLKDVDGETGNALIDDIYNLHKSSTEGCSTSCTGYEYPKAE